MGWLGQSQAGIWKTVALVVMALTILAAGIWSYSHFTGRKRYNVAAELRDMKFDPKKEKEIQEMLAHDAGLHCADTPDAVKTEISKLLEDPHTQLRLGGAVRLVAGEKRIHSMRVGLVLNLNVCRWSSCRVHVFLWDPLNPPAKQNASKCQYVATTFMPKSRVVRLSVASPMVHQNSHECALYLRGLCF